MAHLIDVSQLDKPSIQTAFKLDERTRKIITFVFPLVQDGLLGAYCKFPFAGTILNVDAYCSCSGFEDTIIDIEKISEADFSLNANTWESIFGTTQLTIPASSLSQNSVYNFSSNAVSKNDLFRVNFLHTGPINTPVDDLRIRELTIQITIAI